MDREKARKEVWCGRRRDRRQEGEKGEGEGEQGGGGYVGRVRECSL